MQEVEVPAGGTGVFLKAEQPARRIVAFVVAYVFQTNKGEQRPGERSPGQERGVVGHQAQQQKQQLGR